MNRVILGDCMDFMATCKDNEFDLGIVDPEYRDENQPDIYMRKSGSMKQWQGKPKQDYFDELFRTTRNQIICGGNYFTSNLEENNNWIVWYKNNAGTHLSMAELLWSSIRKNIQVFQLRPMGLTADFHPTSKPIALYKWLLTNYATVGQTIFDSHVGSGSSRIACHDLGFDFTGCELDADYHASQEERYKRHIAQKPLFEPEELRQPEQTSLFEDESCN